MQTEVISIGDEMTSGQRLDTNSQWLSQRSGELGIRVNAILPGWMQGVAQFLPQTYIIYGFRAAMLNGADFQTLLPVYQILFVFGAFWLAIGFALFRRMERRARRPVAPGEVIHGRPLEEASDIMRTAPDLVLSRGEARLFGFSVYRTGEACRRGHRGWRYVSTGNCIDCLKG